MDPVRPSAFAHVIREGSPWKAWHKWPPSTIIAVEDLFVERLEARGIEAGAAYVPIGQWKLLCGPLVVATDSQKHVVDLLPEVKRQQEYRDWVRRINDVLDVQFVEQIETLLDGATQYLDREHILKALRDITLSYRMDARRIALDWEKGASLPVMAQQPAQQPGHTKAVTSIYTFIPTPGHTALSQAIPNPVVSCPKPSNQAIAAKIAIRKRLEARLHEERGRIDKLRRKKRKLQMRRGSITLEQQLLEARAEIVYLNTAIEGLESEG